MKGKVIGAVHDIGIYHKRFVRGCTAAELPNSTGEGIREERKKS